MTLRRGNKTLENVRGSGLLLTFIGRNLGKFAAFSLFT